MAKDDYHVIAYQILSYLYNQLKKGEPIDPGKLAPDGPLFRINETYWLYIMLNLYNDGYIEGIVAKKVRSISGTETTYIDELHRCQITPRGIDYLTDNSFMKKAKELLDTAAGIVPFAGLFNV